jgi:DNA-binding transcriptional MocR family regulator
VPSSRALATALGLSRGLVQECYAQLRAEGYLVTRGGSATRVATAATRAEPARHLPPVAPSRLVADFASERSVGLYGMSTYRSSHAPDPPQLVLGFGNTSQRAIHTGIALISDLLADHTDPGPAATAHR